MTYTEVKELLRSVKSKKRKLIALQQCIEQERALLQSIAGLDFSVPRVKVSGGNTVERLYASEIDRIQTWSGRFEELFKQMCEEEDALSVVMQDLTPTEYEVILNRYILGYSRKKTADIMSYSDDGIKTVQRRAIKKMTKK